MNTKILITAFMLVFTSSYAFSNKISDGGDPFKNYAGPRGVCSKRPNANPNISYNAFSTALTVRLPSNSQGGRVEIYRNGIKVVNATLPAGATLNYMLRNYGKGEFTIIVNQGNTVVYSNSVIVK